MCGSLFLRGPRLRYIPPSFPQQVRSTQHSESSDLIPAT